MYPSSVPADLTYMRFYKDKKVLRVARARSGFCAALYPTEDNDIFETEAFHEVDDGCVKGKINRSEIGDEIWLKLLDNEPIDEILKNVYDDKYVELPADDESIDHIGIPTFRIAKDMEEK